MGHGPLAATIACALLFGCRPAERPPADTQAARGPTPTSPHFKPPFSGQPLSSLHLASGLRIEDFERGSGNEATHGSITRFHYRGYLPDGTLFEDTREDGSRRAHKTTIGSGRGLPAWHAGLLGMISGGKRRLHAPPSLAWGENRYRRVQPNTPVIFDVELLGVSPARPKPQPAQAYAGRPLHREDRAGVEVYEYHEGSGARAQKNDIVHFHYIIKLEDNTVLETSHASAAKKIQMGSAQQVAGLRVGLRGVKVGTLRKLVMPAAMASGERKRRKIHPDAQVTYLVEVTSLERAGVDQQRN